MAESFITRKGGAGKQALAPTITEVSTTDSSITFTITNNDAESAVILWEVGDNTPDENSIELAASATSSNITVDTLDDDTEYTVSATASVTGKVLSNVTSLGITTDPAPVYTNATGGTTLEYDSGGKRYRSHTFTSSGTFTVTQVGDAIDDRNKVDYLIIAGGGSGGRGTGIGGGGAAGGFRTTVGTQGGLGTLDSKVTVTAQAYSIDVGAGGATGDPGNNGSNSSALGITSTGGGRGGGGGSTSGFLNGENGGSGGGAGEASGVNGTGGTGTVNQGFGGGNATSPGVGGGGGAGQAGASSTTGANPKQSGKGGDGLANLLRTGSNETRAGGGGGGGYLAGSFSIAGVGGTGGGGAGGQSEGSAAAGTAGTENTGSGGGGGTLAIGGAGGSGIVIIRYEIAPSV